MEMLRVQEAEKWENTYSKARNAEQQLEVLNQPWKKDHKPKWTCCQRGSTVQQISCEEHWLPASQLIRVGPIYC